MSVSLLDEPLREHEELRLHFSHRNGQAEYFVKEPYSPLDIRTRFAGSSPHTLVSSSSSSSSHRNSPDEADPPFESTVELTEAASRRASLLYHSDSPVSSLRSDEEQPPHHDTTLQGIRMKRRKQNNPIKCGETDRSNDEDNKEGSTGTSTPVHMTAEMFTLDHHHSDEATTTTYQEPMENERMDGVSTSVSSPGSVSVGQRNSGSMTGGRVFPTGPTGVQIFNTDAYCELCNREFCNKYFLKTHKANKHGVYDASLPPPSPTGGRTSDQEDMLLAQQADDQMHERPSQFFPSAQTDQSSGRLKETKRERREMLERNPQEQQMEEEEMKRQQLLQMYAQTLALQQMYHQQTTQHGQLFLPGHPMLHMPGMHPAMQLPPFNMLNFLGLGHSSAGHPLMPAALPWISHHQQDLQPPPLMNPFALASSSSSPMPESTSQPEELSGGPESHAEEGGHVCDICLKRLSSKNFLRNHRRRKHGIGQDDNDRPLVLLPKEEHNEAQFNQSSTATTDAIDMSRIAESSKDIDNKMDARDRAHDHGTTTIAVLPVVIKKRRRSKKSRLEQEMIQRTAPINLHRDRDIEEGRPSSTTTIGPESYSFQTPPSIPQFQSMPGVMQPTDQFSNLQRLLQGSFDPRTGRRETFRCSECLTDYASREFLESHLIKNHPRIHVAMPEATVLDLSTPKSRSRRSGENHPPPLHSSRPHSSPRPQQQQQQQQQPSPRKRPCPPPSQAQPEEGVMEEGVVMEGGGSGGLDLECYCTKCKREYCSKYFLRTHLKKEHQMTTEQYLEEVRLVYPDVWQQYMTPPGGMDASVIVSASGGSNSRRNWCRWCKKDFCNKYFFKTHMQKMHNEVISPIASHRSAKKRSKGVPCDICNKHLCSKYFLRIHKRNTHGIVDPTLDSVEPHGSPSFVPSMSRLPSFNSGSFSGDEREEERMDSTSTPRTTHSMFVDEEEEEMTVRPTVITSAGTHLIHPASLNQGDDRSPELEGQSDDVRSNRSLSPAALSDDGQCQPSEDEWDSRVEDPAE